MDFGVGWWLVHAGMVAAAGVHVRAAHAAHPPAAGPVARGASRTLERYLARQIYAAVGFVLLGFLALFAFFDLIRELGDLGNGDYQLRQVFTFVLLSMPTHAYELFPIAVLIGTLYVLAHLASNSEYTVMRGSGPVAAARRRWSLAQDRPRLRRRSPSSSASGSRRAAEEAAQKVKLRAMSSLIGQDLQSGLWFKDEGSFINVREARQANSLGGVRIFEFDAELPPAADHLGGSAPSTRGKGVWRLQRRGADARSRPRARAPSAHAELGMALGGDARTCSTR